MGLDINIRYRREGSVPIDTTFYGYQEFNKEDISYGPDYSGRYEFHIIQDWVGKNRYGKYIAIDDQALLELNNIILNELDKRNKEELETAMEYGHVDSVGAADLPSFLDNSYGLSALLIQLNKAPLFKRYGWILELECDW